MLVKDCMTRHPIMIPPSTPATEAQKIMAENKVHHLPVAGDGKRLLGLITPQRLALKSDILGSLDVWEITRRLADLTVKEVMLKARNVRTIEPDCTIERAARYLTDNKVGCLPVIEEGVVIGILTETDVLKSYQEMLGLPAEGVRVTVRMLDKPNEFAKLTTTLAAQEWCLMGIGTYPSPRKPGYYDVVLKISGITLEEAQAVLSQIPEQEIIDIRDVV